MAAQPKRVINQSMLSSSSSSSSSSSLSSVESVSKQRRPMLSSTDKVEVVKPSLLGRHPGECTLNDYKTMQLTREQVCQNLSSPFFEELMKSSYVRIVSGMN